MSGISIPVLFLSSLILSKFSTASWAINPKTPLLINSKGSFSLLNWVENSWTRTGMSIDSSTSSIIGLLSGKWVVNFLFFNSIEAIGLQHMYEKF